MECKLCNLCENCARPVAGRPFLDTGASPAEIMLIGDFPKREDITYGKPFSDKLSVQLANLLNTSKLPADKIYITNLVKCRPVAPNGLDGRLKIANVQACQVHLIEEIATVNPKLIILFGDSVFRYFYPNESFSDNRGKILSNNQFNIPTIATYHPQAMLATAKFDQIINTDLAKAYSFLYGDEQETQKPIKDYRLVTKSLKLLESIAKRVKEVPTFAFDIETHGEGLFNYKLLSLGLSWKKDTGVSIPVWVLDKDKADKINAAINYVQPERFIEETVTLKSGKTKIKKTKNKEWLKEDDEAIKSLLPDEYKDLVGTCTFRELKLKLGAILDKEPPLKKYWGDQHDHCMALIKEIMECDTPKGAHNGSYDVNRLRGIGINVKNYDWDTILEHHLLDEERPHGLDDLSFVYTKDGGYKSGKNVYLKSTKTSWANIPMEVLLPYNAQDADVTFQLHEIFVPKIKESEKRWKLYMNHIMPAQRMLCDMEFRGSNIDMSWVQKTKKEYLTKMNDLKIKFSQLVEKVIPNVYVVDSPAEQKDMELQIKEKAKQEGTEPKFPFFLNMNSTQQLLVLFRDYYKVPLTKKTKSGDALDSDVLKKIGKKLDAANVLLEYKVLKKVVSTYLDSMVEKIDADGKLHTEFLLYGTRTSRLSSRNPNLQNQPAEVKYMFVPPSKDYVCVNVDQSAAELHVLAWLSNDKKMMGIFEAHRDLHKETAAAVFNKKMEDITEEERKIAKRTGFGVAYGISGVGLKDLLEPEGVKITDKQGDKFIKKWRDTYPGCARYLDNASKNFNRYGYLETPFGRRRHKYKHYMSQEKEAAASRQAGNFLIQSTASDIQVYEMVHMYKTLVDNGVLPVFTVHDSIVMYCPINKLEWLRDYYKQETCRRFQQLNNLLMYTEMEVGRNYGEHVKLPYDCDFDAWKKTNAFLFGETNESEQGL